MRDLRATPAPALRQFRLAARVSLSRAMRKRSAIPRRREMRAVAGDYADLPKTLTHQAARFRYSLQNVEKVFDTWKILGHRVQDQGIKASLLDSREVVGPLLRNRDVPKLS